MDDATENTRPERLSEGLKQRMASRTIKNADAAGRPPLRDDDPRARARARAEELRNHGSLIDNGADEFYIPPEIIPDGWHYEWKTHSILNQEQGTYLMQLAREGWTPVRASKHPEMMHKGAGDDPIMRKGMILMECPLEIIEERRRQQLKLARDQVRFKEAQLAGTPDGTMTRDHAQVRPSIKKGFEPMPIPD